MEIIVNNHVPLDPGTTNIPNPELHVTECVITVLFDPDIDLTIRLLCTISVITSEPDSSKMVLVVHRRSIPEQVQNRPVISTAVCISNSHSTRKGRRSKWGIS